MEDIVPIIAIVSGVVSVIAFFLMVKIAGDLDIIKQIMKDIHKEKFPEDHK